MGILQFKFVDLRGTCRERMVIFVSLDPKGDGARHFFIQHSFDFMGAFVKDWIFNLFTEASHRTCVIQLQF